MLVNKGFSLLTLIRKSMCESVHANVCVSESNPNRSTYGLVNSSFDWGLKGNLVKKKYESLIRSGL